MKRYVVLDSGNADARKGFGAAFLYAIYANSGLHSIVAALRDGRVSAVSEIYAFCIDGVQDYHRCVVRLVYNNLYVSDGVEIWVVEPECTVSQSRLTL